ncbi:MAG: NAD-dependent succinate-semialdehyde dehydrogenase [Planctomycetota bacterium]
MTDKQLIDGQWVDALSGGTWDVIDPATEDVVRTVPFGDDSDCRAAIEAAERAFPAWSAMPAHDRGKILRRAAGILAEREDELVETTVRESGKPAVEARGEWRVAVELIEWFAEEGRRAYGRTIPSRAPSKRHLVLRHPIGVVGVITAWNFPAYNPIRSWAAALGAGCTVVGRASEYTPLTAMALAAAFDEAGLPPGVLNLVNGEPESMGREMLRNPACRHISFTGSVRVGRILMDGAGETFTRLSLELGGNAPVIVYPDADLERLAKTAVPFRYRNCGQVCIAPQRYFLHESIEQRFLDLAAEQVASLQVGSGLAAATNVGPLINRAQLERVERIVDTSVDAGGRVLAGGKRPVDLERGYFFEPTLLAGVPSDAPAFQEEIFGPVLAATSFDDVDTVVARANATPYGLAAYVWTNDLSTAMRTAEGLEFGMVSVNEWAPHSVETPFLGWKQSGLGAESGKEGLDEYLETKLVTIGGLS